MMVAAWCVLASFGMLMPRYYKPTWPGKTCCGKAIWFQVATYVTRGRADHFSLPGIRSASILSNQSFHFSPFRNSAF